MRRALRTAACVAIATSLPAVAWGQPGRAPPDVRVTVYFDARRPGVRLYELDPARPSDRVPHPLCESPCERLLAPFEQSYFYEGDGIARSRDFTLPSGYPALTIQAEPKSALMGEVGAGLVGAGALGIPVGIVVALLGAYGAVEPGGKLVFGGLSTIPIAALALGIGIGLLQEGKSSVRIRPGWRPPVSLRLGPTGAALVF